MALVCTSGFARGARVVVALSLPEAITVALGTVVGASKDGRDPILHVAFEAMREMKFPVTLRIPSERVVFVLET